MGVILLVLTSALVSACADQHRSQPIAAEFLQQCPEQRPQMCTLEYAPVCAFLEKKQRQQFSNGCSACSDPAVVGFTAGSCP